MSEVAVHEGKAATPVVRPPEIVALDIAARVGVWAAGAQKGDEAQARALAVYYAQALGFSPHAAGSIHFFKGRIVLGADMIRALAHKDGYRVERTKLDDKSCTASLLNAQGVKLGETTYTLAQAAKSGLVRDGSVWKTDPGRMMWARASSLVVRDFAPHVALGMVAHEEIAEVEDDEYGPVDPVASGPLDDLPRVDLSEPEVEEVEGELVDDDGALFGAPQGVTEDRG